MVRKVAVIMGSDSDWPVVKGACAQLKALDIPFEAHILSAHRTPAEAAAFAKSAKANGFGVILCAAGMAAHLAGAFAANTTLPVIGIPMKGGAMDGLDALLATVQMPSGIPVATVALNGAKNAAWLAAEILALSDDALAEKLEAERIAMAAQIAAKEEKLQAEMLLEYDNVKLYSFADMFDLTQNLDNYKDDKHYNAEISEKIIDWIYEGTGLITKENYEERINKMEDFYLNQVSESSFSE